MMRKFLQRKFVQDTLALQVSKIVSVGISFVSSVLIVRLIGPSEYGEWALAVSFLAIWQSFNLTGIGPSTITRLSAAVGAQDTEETLNLMGFYVRISMMWAAISIVSLAILGAPLASRLYTTDVTLLSTSLLPVTFQLPETSIGYLAAVYAWALIPDSFYNLVIIALQSRRSMRTAAMLQNINTLMLAACVVTAMVLNPTATGMLIGRLAYSFSTMLVALWLYHRERTHDGLAYPTIRVISARARTVPVRRYWRLGFAIALDRNLANYFLQIPMQMVGIIVGTEAAGYLQLALKAIQLPQTMTSAVFDNMQAVVPQAIGRGDYARLWHNFNRVILILAVGSVGFYGLLVVLILGFGKPVAAFLYGEAWLPAVPLLGAIAYYGAITTIGGIFGPLYRALGLMREAILVKIVALILATLAGLWLVNQMGALGGAWAINVTFTLSISFTAIVTLPELRRRAAEQLSFSGTQVV
jgi:O-antigen/teichoic acid export membrane protein